MKKTEKRAHPGTLRQRGRGWQWDVTLSGHRFVELFSVETEEEALSALFQLLPRLREAAGGIGDSKRPLIWTVEQLANDFLMNGIDHVEPQTRAAYERHIRVFLQWARGTMGGGKGSPMVRRVTASGLIDYLTYRKEHPLQRTLREEGRLLSDETVARHRASLSGLFSWAIRRGCITVNPVANATLKTRKRRGVKKSHLGRFISEAEYEALLREAENRSQSPFLPLFILLCGEAGLRPDSEALSLRWSDLDFEQNSLIVVDDPDGTRGSTKTGTRPVPLTGRLRAALLKHQALHRGTLYGEPGNRSPWVLHKTRGNGAGERLASLRKAFQKTVEAAGMEYGRTLKDEFGTVIGSGVTPYSLRHRRATTWLLRGHPSVVVAEALGNSVRVLEEHYAHIMIDHLQGLVEDGFDGVPAPTPEVPERVLALARG